MTTNTQRFALSLLLASGAGACSSDPPHAESARAASDYAGAESDTYGDQTVIMDSPGGLTPTNPDQNLPGEPGSISPTTTTRSRDSQIATDVPGILPGDEPPPPVVPIDETTPAQGTQGSQAQGTPAQGRQGASAADNTDVNERDREDSKVTPSDQGTSARDLEITQRIREAVMGNDQLSFTAKNVKVITRDGKVFLRGPVRNQNERRAIEKTAVSVAGEGQVTNELEIPIER